MSKQLLLAALALFAISATAQAQYSELPGYVDIPGNILAWNPDEKRETTRQFWQDVLNTYSHLKPFSTFFLGDFSTVTRRGFGNVKLNAHMPDTVAASSPCMPRADGEELEVSLIPLAPHMPYAEEDEAVQWGLVHCHS